MFQRGNLYHQNSRTNQKAMLLRAELTRRMSLKDVRDIYDMLLFKALNEHDVVAARELLDRVLGKSRQPVEMSGPDGGPIERLSINLGKLSDKELELVRQMSLKAGEIDRDSGDTNTDQENIDDADNEELAELIDGTIIEDNVSDELQPLSSVDKSIRTQQRNEARKKRLALERNNNIGGCSVSGNTSETTPTSGSVQTMGTDRDDSRKQ